MIHHPIVLGAKAVVLLVIIVVLIILHGMLPPEQFRTAVFISIGVFVLSIVVIWAVFLGMLNNPDSKLAKQMILQDTPKDSQADMDAENERLASLTGTPGTAETNLRPSGIGNFNGDLIDVIAERSFIEKDAEIVVVNVKGKKVTVKKL